MSDIDFRPADTDSANQHFAHAALEEFARLGSKNDEAFLAKVGEKLDEIDHETDVSGLKIVALSRSSRVKTLWISGAAAVALVLGVIPILQQVKEEERRTDSPQIVAVAELDVYEGKIEDENMLAKRKAISGPVSPNVLPNQIDLARVDKSPDERLISSGILVPEPTEFDPKAMKDGKEYIFLSRQIQPNDGAYDLGVVMRDDERDTSPKLYNVTAGYREEIKVPNPIGHFNLPLSEAFINNTRLGQGGQTKNELASAPVPPLNLAASEQFGAGGYDMARGKDSRITRGTDDLYAETPTLPPSVGYNGTAEGWLANSPSPSNDGIPGANANDVFYGGVRLNVGFGDEPQMPQPVTRSAIHDQAKSVASNTLSVADPNPKPGHSINEKIEQKVVSQNEKYGQLIDNPFASPLKDPLSTFSVIVDTASYSNIRRMITAGQMIPADAVRIEEMINYFSYDYPQPEGEHPFSFAAETAKCPWNPDHQLLRVAIQGKDLQRDARQPANLVFLLDVSGSMNDPNKLPLVKQSMELLIEELTERDTISVVVYAGSEGLCLPATSGSEKQKILDSLTRLQAGGSTNGGAGIDLAYKMAKESYKTDGINRVVLCTDGDFNVGRVDNGSLVELVEKKAKDGTYLSVLGFGSGNINDSMLEEITNKGNGNYFYIDSIKEGRKVLLEEMMSTLVTIAKDVKIQVEFNPKQVQDYRLIGYANRMLKAEDFENDTVDAGEVGAGHSVTALYEIVPMGAPPVQKQGPNLKYQAPIEPEQPKMKLVESNELCTLKLRYKLPKSDVSIPMELAITTQQREWKEAGDDYQFAVAVGLWGMLLRESEHCGKASSELILEMAEQGRGADPFGRRAEFISLVKEWARLKELGGVSQKGGLNQNDVFHGGVRLNVGF